jgi:hypothetical protein
MSICAQDMGKIVSGSIASSEIEVNGFDFGKGAGDGDGDEIWRFYGWERFYLT